MRDVLGRMRKENPLSIHDFKTEINVLKLEVVQLRRRIEFYRLR